MAIVTCEKGHFFDNAKYEKCPYCRNIEHERNRYEEQLREGVTVAMPHVTVVDASREQTPGVHKPVLTDDQKTVGVFSKQSGKDFVTGWLVCVKGKEKGRDYRLHNGNNWIGRGYQMDICIVDDPMISRENHATLVYDYKSGRFFLSPGKGTATYLNGQAIPKAVELKKRDRITLGESEFVFVPFCGEDYTWEKENG